MSLFLHRRNVFILKKRTIEYLPLSFRVTGMKKKNRGQSKRFFR